MRKIGKSLKGVITALVTPFKRPFEGREGPVDFEAYKWLIERQIEGGVAGIVPCGTTGESPTLSHEEHGKVIQMAAKYVGGRVPVIAGTGSNYTAEAEVLTLVAKNVGADAALVVEPYYNKPTEAGLFDYYRRVAKVGLPVILYTIPGRCGGKGATLKVILQLMREGSIAGIKWAREDWEMLRAIKSEAPDNFSILSGDDNQTVRIIKMGGHGVISVLSNLRPRAMAAMVYEALSGNTKEAELMEAQLASLMKAMFIETNPIPVKEALALCYPSVFKAIFRSPMVPMADENRMALKKVLADYGLLGGL
ncbi:MAG: 4-hydroxy-tetrahydrodipicolinate synthase [Candidatus Moranbacteria bacterium]|nr:4-hydroxy-tetrahydrodipicolinate synthase [Candidatus Moranbacteria bacterium]